MTFQAQNPLPFPYIFLSKQAETTTSAVVAAPLVIAGPIIIPVRMLADTINVCWVEGVDMVADMKMSVGVENGNIAVQRSLDGGTTWATTALPVSGAVTSAVYTTVNPTLTGGARMNPTASSLRFRAIAYVSVGAETLSLKNFSCKFILHVLV